MVCLSFIPFPASKVETGIRLGMGRAALGIADLVLNSSSPIVQNSLDGRFSLAFPSSQLFSSQEKCAGSLDRMLVLGDGALIHPQLSFGVITACLLCSSSVNENNSTSVKMSCWSLEDGSTKPSQALSY